MFYLAILLILSHIIVDFYTQSKSMVERKSGLRGKKTAVVAHVVHAGEHYLAFLSSLTIWFYLMGGNIFLFAYPILYAGVAYAFIHLVTDALKETLKNKYPKKDLLFFVLDQLIHFSTIILCVVLIEKFDILKFAMVKNEHIKGIASIVLVGCGLLILLRPVSFFVEKFLHMAMAETKITHIKVTKSHISKMLEDNLKVKLNALMDSSTCAPAVVNATFTEYRDRAEIIIQEIPNVKPNIESNKAFSSNKGGQWIGYVERVMIFTFFMFGQFTAIAAMMAIKTAFRFNDLKDDNDSHRSEYIMLGTFVSLFITFITSLVIKHYINVKELANFLDSLVKPFM